jgi:Rps23 Pro-64 3,4-dihydroxylase Tpa1-like proline 4-hydroxylase
VDPLVWDLGPAWDDEALLRRAWQAAEPFPHLVFDDFVRSEWLERLVDAIDGEPASPYQADIFAFDATAPKPRTTAFCAVRDSFANALGPRLSRITDKKVSRVDMRAYAYRAGHFLLPHSDHQEGVDRALAYAYYLPSPEPPVGGELELFRCERERSEIVATESAKLIDPKANRLVVFDVGDVSLHQVREVLSGLRPSLSGWFYP